MERNTQLLLLFLRENLVLRYAHGPLKRLFTTFGNTYREQTKYGGSTGHYDWLRSASGDVQGVRHWPFDDKELAPVIEPLLNACRSLPYARVENGKHVKLFFTSSPRIDEDASQDQDLSNNGIYRSDAGEFLLYFDTSALSPNERNSLARIAKEFAEGET